MKFILAFFLSLFILSCNNSSEETITEDNMDSSEINEVIEEEQLLSAADFSKNFQQLNQFLSEWDSSFSPAKFSLAEEIQMDNSPWNEMEPDILEFQPYFVINADSTLALDLVSYNFIINKRNENQKLEFAGPDTEVGLIDLKKNLRKRILFLGSSAMVLDGKWDEKGNIIIAGAQDAGAGNLQPVMWRIDPVENIMQTSAYPGTIKANVSEYYKLKYRPFKTSRVV
jgi:hypothetical protein